MKSSDRLCDVENTILGRLVDIHVQRGTGRGVSDQFLVEARMKEELCFKRSRKQVQCGKS